MEAREREERLARFERTGNRTMGNYLEGELTALADLAYEGVIADSYRDPDPQVVERRRMLVSLERFDLADHGHIYDRPPGDPGRMWSSWGWAITDAGREALAARLPFRYGCCSHAIRLPCVCLERIYCPDPDHRGGCHGSHD